MFLIVIDFFFQMNVMSKIYIYEHFDEMPCLSASSVKRERARCQP